MKEKIEIDDKTYADLEKVAKRNGYETVEELLTAIAENFSTGCSVTLPRKAVAA